MEQVDTLLESSLQTGEVGKQLHALAGLLQEIAIGADVSRFTNQVVQHCLRGSTHRNVRKFAYEVIKSGQHTISQWEAIIPTLSQDLVSSDTEMRVSALRVLTRLPSLSLQQFLATSEMLVLQCFEQREPQGLADAITVLGEILTPPSLQIVFDVAHNFVRESWSRIAQSCAHADSSVAHAAFGVLRSFIHGLPLRVEIDETFSKPVFTVVSVICDTLLPMLPTLMARFATLDDDRYNCPEPLVFLSCYPQEDDVSTEWADDGVSPLPDSHGVVKRTSALVENHLTPLLSTANSALVSEAGRAIMAIVSTTRRQVHCREWTLAVAESFLVLMKTTDGRLFDQPVLEDLVRLVPLLDPHDVFPTIRQAFAHIFSCQDPSVRSNALLRLSFTLQIESIRARAAYSAAKESAFEHERPKGGELRTPMNLLAEDEWFRAVAQAERPSREELAFAMCESCLLLFTASASELPESNMPLEDRIAQAIDTLFALQPCLAWRSQQRTFAPDSFLHLLGRVALEQTRMVDGSRNAQLQQLFDRCLADFDRVVHDSVRTKLLLVLCAFIDLGGSDSNNQSKITDLVVRRLRRVDRFNEIAQELEQNTQRGVLGSANAPRLELSQNIDAAILSALTLGCRTSSVLDDLDTTFAEIMARATQDRVMLKQLFDMVKKRIRGLHSLPSENHLDSESNVPIPPPPPADAMDVAEHTAINRPFVVGVTEAIADLLQRPKVEHKPVRRNESHPIFVSGSSDALQISCFHETFPERKSITLHVRVVNSTDLEVPGVTIGMAVSGCLDFVDGHPNASYEIDELAPQEREEFSHSFAVTYFGDGAVFFLLSVQNGQTLRYGAYEISSRDLASPADTSYDNFLADWHRLPYTEKVFLRLKPSVTIQQLLGELYRSPFHVVMHRSWGNYSYHMLACASKTWFDDVVVFTLTAAQDHGPAATGDEPNGVWQLQLELRSSAEQVLLDIADELDRFLFSIFGGLVVLVERFDLLEQTSRDELPGTAAHTRPQVYMQRWEQLTSEGVLPRFA